MTKVSISEAIRLSGRSRQYFYENYIKTNLLTIDRTNPSRPKVEISDLLRFFPELKKDNKDETKEQITGTSLDTRQKDKNEPEYSLSLREELAKIKAENDGLKALIQSKDEQIAMNHQQIQREREIAEGEKIRAVKAEERYSRLIESKEIQSKKRWFQIW